MGEDVRTMGTPIISRVLEVRVIDGDSLEMLLDLGHYVRMTVVGRLTGVDAPERSTSAGKSVAAWAQRWIEAKPGIEWVSQSLDKYRRSLGDLRDAEHPSLTLAGSMLEKKLCRPYSGEARQPWSEDELFAIADRVRLLMK